MSYTEALYDMLAFMSANPALTKGIQLEVNTQDCQVEVKEAKQPERLVYHFKLNNNTILQLKMALDCYTYIVFL